VLAAAERLAGPFSGGALPPTRGEAPFTTALAAALRACGGAERGATVSPVAMKRELGRRFADLRGNSQCDAAGFLVRLLDLLADETGHPPGVGAADWGGTAFACSGLPAPSIVRDVCGLRLRRFTRFLDCFHVRAVNEFESVLKLPIPCRAATASVPVLRYRRAGADCGPGTYTQFNVFFQVDARELRVGHVLALLRAREARPRPGEWLEVTAEVAAAADRWEDGEDGAGRGAPLLAYLVDPKDRVFLTAAAPNVSMPLDEGQGLLLVVEGGSLPHAPGEPLPEGAVNEVFPDGAPPPLTLNDCLWAAAEREREGALGAPCATCAAPARELHRWFRVDRAPPVLLLNLLRFDTSAQPARKVETPVALPLRLDTLHPLLDTPGDAGDAAYDLAAVVLHAGNVDGGHYTAMVRAPSGRWLHCDDGAISEKHPAALEKELREQTGAFKVVVALFTKREGGGGGPWVCGNCTLVNRGADAACAACDAPPPRWACPACTFMNARGAIACEMCNATP
jgi:hypothetical protein